MKTSIWVAAFIVLQQHRNLFAYGANIDAERASLSESIESIFNGSITDAMPFEGAHQTPMTPMDLTEEETEQPELAKPDITESEYFSTSTRSNDDSKIGSGQQVSFSQTSTSGSVDTDTTTQLTESTSTNPTSTIAPETAKPTEAQQAMRETVQIIRIPTSNIILGNPPIHGSIGGVISEALKLAQVSIAVFGSQLLGTLLGGPTYVISNTTRLVGVGE